MILGTACLGERALDGMAVRAALATVGLDRALLVVGSHARPSALEGLRAAAVRAASPDVDKALAVARASGARRLVVDLDAALSLEKASRQLFALARGQPGLALAVLTPQTGELARPEQLGLLFDDLSSMRLGYWHRPSRAHLASQSDGPWLDRLGSALVGVSLDDVADGQPGLPPGVGQLDFQGIAESAAASLEVALDVESVADVALLRLALDGLRTAGFR